MVERTRQERFDNFLQILIVVEVVMLEYAWSFVESGLLLILLFICGLSIWALAELSGGANEYVFKIVSFLSLVYGLYSMLFVCIAPRDTPWLLVVVQLGFGVPLVSLTLSYLAISYLGELVDRRKALLLLVGFAGAISAGFFLTVLTLT